MARKTVAASPATAKSTRKESDVLIFPRGAIYIRGGVEASRILEGSSNLLDLAQELSNEFACGHGTDHLRRQMGHAACVCIGLAKAAIDSIDFGETA